ncbi:MAG: hypothetical protein MUC28_03775 [Planctomycetes bacterium]|nr:hypothetical protein [Planctomycetota bacterium]
MENILIFVYHYGGGYYLSLTESDKGKIIRALDEANIRPESCEFIYELEEGDDDIDGTTFLYLSYKIEGRDRLNIKAKCYKFAEEIIEPVLQKAVPCNKSKLFSLYKVKGE